MATSPSMILYSPRDAWTLLVFRRYRWRSETQQVNGVPSRHCTSVLRMACRACSAATGSRPTRHTEQNRVLKVRREIASRSKRYRESASFFFCSFERARGPSIVLRSMFSRRAASAIVSCSGFRNFRAAWRFPPANHARFVGVRPHSSSSSVSARGGAANRGWVRVAGVAAFAAPILLACVPLAFPAPFVRAMVDERECSVESLSASLDSTNGWAYLVRASGVRWRDSDGSDVFIECCDARMEIIQNVAALLSYLRGKSSRLSGSCGSLVVRGVRGTMVINKDEEPTPIHSVPAPVATAIIAALRAEDVCLQVRAKRTVTREDSIVDPGAQAAGITCTLESADARDVWLHRAALDVLFGGSTAATGACLGGSVRLVPRAGAQQAEWRINQLHLQPSQLSAAGFVDETLVRAAVTATCDARARAVVLDTSWVQLFPPLPSLRATADVVVRASVLSEADAATRASSVNVANKLGTGLVLGLLAGQSVNVELADAATRRIAEAGAGDIALARSPRFALCLHCEATDAEP